MSEQRFDCVVIGSGPGGYVAAIRAAQLGLKVGVVEREAPGGVCLNWGCIPTKALLKSAEMFHAMSHASDYGLSAESVTANFPDIIDRSRGVVSRMTKGVQFLFRKNKIELISGHGRFAGPGKIEVEGSDGNKKSLSYKSAIISTGARARAIPSLPVDRERIITYREALVLKKQPKKLLVIGAGAIGVEFAYFFNTLGSEVTVVEMMDQILPIEDEELSGILAKSFTKSGMKIRTGTKVEKLERNGETVRAELSKDSTKEVWEGDHCLVAIGVQGNVEDLGLEKVGIVPDKSYIKVDKFYQTKQPGIYAIGDVVGAPWLAHVASHEGIIAAEHLSGQHPEPLEYSQIPGCTYCQPQVASIGITEKQAVEQGLKVKVGRFPFSASGKAVAIGETDGLVKVIVDQEVEEVLGVHIIHAEATELIGEAAVAISHEAVASSILHTIHAHPTLSEAVMEAMGDALGQAVHI